MYQHFGKNSHAYHLYLKLKRIKLIYCLVRFLARHISASTLNNILSEISLDKGILHWHWLLGPFWISCSVITCNLSYRSLNEFPYSVHYSLNGIFPFFTMCHLGNFIVYVSKHEIIVYSLSLMYFLLSWEFLNLSWSATPIIDYLENLVLAAINIFPIV